MSAGAAELREISTLLVFGLGVTGRAVARAAVKRGITVVLADDAPGSAAIGLVDELGTTIHDMTGADPARLASFVSDVDALVPSPGLAVLHPVFAAARAAGVPTISEFDLAAAWDDRPLVAITGTNGKTTVTTIVTDMLRRSGIVATDAGNTEIPLVEAIDDPDIECFVVEASSFRLGHSRHFAPSVGTWLNFAPDHLDVHDSLGSYESAKAAIWRDQSATDVAVANLDDPVVMRHAVGPAQLVTFGLGGEGSSDRPAPTYRSTGGWLRRVDVPLIETGALFRALPHDIANALAAAATASAAGATDDGVRDALVAFRGLAHRVELVGEHDGVRWFDDSKATVPHAVGAAVGGFDSVVLIAGGRNKGLDLGALREFAPPVRAVVGIGEAGPEVVDVLGHLPHVVADSMDEAVDAAAALAVSGDTVVLSPGCTSFDWYGSYAERGDDFAASVRTRVLGEAVR